MNPPPGTTRRLIPWLPWLVVSAALFIGLLVLALDGGPEVLIVPVTILGVWTFMLLLAIGTSLATSLLLDRLRHEHPESIVVPVLSAPEFGWIASDADPGRHYSTSLLGVLVLDNDGVALWSSRTRWRRGYVVPWNSVVDIRSVDSPNIQWRRTDCVRFDIRFGSKIEPLEVAPVKDGWRLLISIPDDPKPTVEAVHARGWVSTGVTTAGPTSALGSGEKGTRKPDDWPHR